jgi:hypothetical protein
MITIYSSFQAKQIDCLFYIYVSFFVCVWVPISTTIKSDFNQAGFLFSTEIQLLKE